MACSDRNASSPASPFALLLACRIAVACVVSLACVVPGRPVAVLPEVAGRIDATEGRVTLVVMHRESPALHARQEVALETDGRFRFAPIALDVAGHEFSKHYRVYLHLGRGESDRVIWRADLSRLADPNPIRLDCTLARPLALGEPCRVDDPLSQPWLLADGRRHFERLCSDCHGERGEGGARAPDLTRIAERQGGRFDRDAVAARIEGRTLASSHARDGMPIWGERLSERFERHAEGDELVGATLDPLVAYLESLQRGDRSADGAPRAD